jgi:hypothetical protein
VSLLLRKEWRELRAARAWWIFLAAVGVLVGQAYVTAVGTYAEVSGAGGGPAALAQGVSPLDGFLVPLFGAYAIAATLLLPFVAIRVLAAEKEGGGLALTLQGGVRPITLVLAKLVVLLAGWLVALVPAVVALALWTTHGGHLDAGELAVVLLGHLLRAGFTIALGLAAAALTESASTAAIVALGVTLATWALDFVGAVRGGGAQRLAELTPESALRVFERGELSVAVVATTLVATFALLAIAATGLAATRSTRRAASLVALLLGGTAIGLAGTMLLRGSVDLSEDRRNSLPRADERALRAIAAPLDVEVHLAPEDPRLADLEGAVLRKLRRTLPSTSVRYVAGGSTGLFADDPHYGEVWYTVGSRRAMSRSTTPPIVLETIYQLSGIAAPTTSNEPAYRGYPLVLQAGAAWLIFFVLWPLAVLGAWLLVRRPPSSTELAL